MINKKTTRAGSKPFKRITIRYYDDHREKTVDYPRRYGMDDVLYRLAAYEDEGLSPEEVHKRLEWLKEYVKAEMDGRLLKMPCPIGGTLYVIVTRKGTTHTRYCCEKPEYKSIRRTKLTESNAFKLSAGYGTTVFLTKKEAQKALKILEGNGNGNHD